MPDVTAVESLARRSKFMRLLAFIWSTLRMAPSHGPLSLSSTFTLSLNNSKFLIRNFSFGTPSVISSRRFLRIWFSLAASSLVRAGERKIFLSDNWVFFSKLFARTNLASWWLATVNRRVLGFVRFSSNFPRRFNSTMFGCTLTISRIFLTSSFVGTRFSAFDFWGSSTIPCIRMHWLMLWFVRFCCSFGTAFLLFPVRTVLYVFSTFSQVFLSASSTFFSTSWVNLFSMFRSFSFMSNSSSFSVSLLCVKFRMNRSRTLFSWHDEHSSIASVPKSLIPFTATGVKPVQLVVNWRLALQATHW